MAVWALTVKDHDPRRIFRILANASVLPAAGLVGPLGSSFFLLPTVKRTYLRWKLDGRYQH